MFYLVNTRNFFLVWTLSCLFISSSSCLTCAHGCILCIVLTEPLTCLFVSIAFSCNRLINRMCALIIIIMINIEEVFVCRRLCWTMEGSYHFLEQYSICGQLVVWFKRFNLMMGCLHFLALMGSLILREDCWRWLASRNFFWLCYDSATFFVIYFMIVHFYWPWFNLSDLFLSNGIIFFSPDINTHNTFYFNLHAWFILLFGEWYKYFGQLHWISLSLIERSVDEGRKRQKEIRGQYLHSNLLSITRVELAQKMRQAK
jgi:hypothetical protein